MFSEINHFLEYIKTDKDGKIIRNRIIIITLIIIFALIFNRFVLSPYVSDDLKISLNQSKLLFLNGKSPYDEEIQNYIKGIAGDEKWVVNDNKFEFDVPLFQLMFYLSFNRYSVFYPKKHIIWKFIDYPTDIDYRSTFL